MTVTAEDDVAGGEPGRDLHALLDALFRNSTEAIVVVDETGRLTYATAGAMLITGRDADGIIGASVFDFLHPDDVDAAAVLFARRLEYDGADFGHEIRVRHTSGEWVRVEATASLLPAGPFGACAITLRALADTGLLERSLLSRIAVGEYTNRLSAGFMEAGHSAAVVERVQTSLPEIGLLTGAEVVEVLLERQQQGSVERLAHWAAAATTQDAGPSVDALAPAPATVEMLLSAEFQLDDTSLPSAGVPSCLAAGGIASLLSTPFAVGRQRGVIVLLREAPGPAWTAADIELLRGVAGLYGRALQTARAEALLAHTYLEGPFGFAIRTWEGRLVDCNRRYLDLCGMTAEAAARGDLHAMVCPEHREVIGDAFDRLRRGEVDRISVDVELVRGDGTTFWSQITAVPLRVPGSSEHLVLTSVEDVTETHRQRLELEFAALHDPLTGLANRAAMTAAIEKSARRWGEFPTLLLIDLDRFKSVNDSLGHTVGDRLLQLVAARLTAALRPEDLVARLGGDEFAIVVAGLDDAGARRLAARIQRVTDDDFDVEGRSIPQTMSIGVALGDGCRAGADLLVRADRALNAAKARGRNSAAIFDESLEHEVAALLAIEGELRDAVARSEFEVHFQPEFAVVNGRILGAEALVRWRHPERGLVAAHEFISVAERTGLIDPIGRFALREACIRFAAIDAPGALTLRVNLSAREFARPELADVVHATLDESGLAPRRLCLEMTETTLLEAPEVALATFARLRRIGVQSAIDDFGTGYSSLAYLKRFPVDAVKVDRTFVEDIVTDADSRAIVASIMGLSRALSFEVVAEGVETFEQLAILRELGCERAQGFLVAPALPANDFAELVGTRGSASRGRRERPVRPASCT